MDQHTFQKQRCKFARVCVEVDTSLPLPPFILIHHHVQQVRYEFNTLFCYRCGSIGHVRVECPLSSQENLSTPTTYSSSPTPSTPTSGSAPPQMSSVTSEIVRPKGRKRPQPTSITKGKNTEEMPAKIFNEQRHANVSGESSHQRWVAKQDTKTIEALKNVSNTEVPLTNTFHVLAAEDEIRDCSIDSGKNVVEAMEIVDKPEKRHSSSESWPVKVPAGQGPCMHSGNDGGSLTPSYSADMDITEVPTCPGKYVSNSTVVLPSEETRVPNPESLLSTSDLVENTALAHFFTPNNKLCLPVLEFNHSNSTCPQSSYSSTFLQSAFRNAELLQFSNQFTKLSPFAYSLWSPYASIFEKDITILSSEGFEFQSHARSPSPQRGRPYSSKYTNSTTPHSKNSKSPNTYRAQQLSGAAISYNTSLIVGPPFANSLILEVEQEREGFAREREAQFKLYLHPLGRDLHPSLIHNHFINGFASPLDLNQPGSSVHILPPTIHSMKILSWNCRGASRSEFVVVAHDLIDRYQPQIFVVMDTRMTADRAPAVIQRLPFSDWVHTSAMGMSGGIWVLWHAAEVTVRQLQLGPRMIHLEVEFPRLNNPFLMTAVYNYPQAHLQHQVWNDLINLSNSVNHAAWMVIGCAIDKFLMMFKCMQLGRSWFSWSPFHMEQ
ncbi:UNVERIFIED_CONTAM: hypothetical protein Slati_3094900 [Sesamum latifolium]|uniref:CCHC-type domain-containing protein n=1 Tax=Sesamum latifolium TaxID=2727402 RepID=A0AAW2UWS7_9LAMI